MQHPTSCPARFERGNKLSAKRNVMRFKWKHKKVNIKNKLKQADVQAIQKFLVVQLHQAHDRIKVSLSFGSMEAQQSTL